MKKLLLLLPLLTLLTACKTEAPNCSDKETQKLVKQIANDELTKYGINSKLIKMEIKNIRTLDKNSNTGAYSCAADFIIYVKNSKQSYPITYTSELMDNKEEFYVTVYGF